jgi:hypothetical protein
MELPPLRDDELHRLLSRNAQRYFLHAREPQVIGASAGKRGNSPMSVVGAAASARLVAAIESAARSAGWTVEAIVPAEAGWRGAALTIWPALRRGVSHLLVHLPDRIDMLRMEDGRLAAVRHFRPGAADAALIGDLLTQSRDNGTAPRVAAIGSREKREELTRVLSDRGIVVMPPPPEWRTNADDAALVAASFSAPGEPLALRTEAALVARSQRYRYLTTMVFLLSTVLLGLAGWMHLSGVRSTLAAVEAERTALRPRLQESMVGRATYEASFAKLAELREAERTAPRWTRVLAAVTNHLDDDAHLVAFRTRGDTLLLEGRAVAAGPVIDQLANTPGLANLRSTGQVQRDLQRSGESLDKFSVSAQLIPPPAPRSTPTRTQAVAPDGGSPR